jgi:riboflavin synthase
MFTGIVEDLGRVAALDGSRLVVTTGLAARDVGIGDSIAVDGVCLTVVQVARDRLSFDVSQETFDRTTLGSVAAEDEVNLELPATLVTRLGGHLVQGHVDGVATVASVRPSPDGGAVLSVRLPAELAPYVVEKGSIAIDGVSLTVAAVRGSAIDIALIPHTRRATTLGAAREGDPVNVEVDLVAKYVVRSVEALMSGGVTAEPGKERTA